MRSERTGIMASEAARMIRNRGVSLPTNGIYPLAKLLGVGRIVQSPHLGLCFTASEVEVLIEEARSIQERGGCSRYPGSVGMAVRALLEVDR